MSRKDKRVLMIGIAILIIFMAIAVLTHTENFKPTKINADEQTEEF